MNIDILNSIKNNTYINTSHLLIKKILITKFSTINKGSLLLVNNIYKENNSNYIETDFFDQTEWLIYNFESNKNLFINLKILRNSIEHLLPIKAKLLKSIYYDLLKFSQFLSKNKSILNDLLDNIILIFNLTKDNNFLKNISLDEDENIEEILNSINTDFELLLDENINFINEEKNINIIKNEIEVLNYILKDGILKEGIIKEEKKRILQIDDLISNNFLLHNQSYDYIKNKTEDTGILLYSEKDIQFYLSFLIMKDIEIPNNIYNINTDYDNIEEYYNLLILKDKNINRINKVDKIRNMINQGKIVNNKIVNNKIESYQPYKLEDIKKLPLEIKNTIKGKKILIFNSEGLIVTFKKWNGTSSIITNKQTDQKISNKTIISLLPNIDY